MQSPAYEFIWDRQGGQENVFQDFATLAGCTGGGLACLRALSSETVVDASTALNSATAEGTFSVGPSADGSFIRQLPVLELSLGNFWKLDSLIVSHVSDESSLFVDGHVTTDAEFTDFINGIFPNYTKTAGLTAKIEEFYPPVDTSNTYDTETDRVTAFLRDSSFTCNTRYLTDAYGSAGIPVWNMQYSVSTIYLIQASPAVLTCPKTFYTRSNI